MRRIRRRTVDAFALLVLVAALVAVFAVLFEAARAQGATVARHHGRMRVMADSGPVNAWRIKQLVPQATIIAASPGWGPRQWAEFGRGYVKLRYTHSWQDWRADILDVEPGYASAADVPRWLDLRRQHGLGPGTVYANVSRIGQVRAAAGSRPFFWWASNQTGAAHCVPGAVATQWYGSGAARKLGQPWPGVDISQVCDPNWPPGAAEAHGAGPAPLADPATAPQPSRGARPVPAEAPPVGFGTDAMASPDGGQAAAPDAAAAMSGADPGPGGSFIVPALIVSAVLVVAIFLGLRTRREHAATPPQRPAG